MGFFLPVPLSFIFSFPYLSFSLIVEKISYQTAQKCLSVGKVTPSKKEAVSGSGISPDRWFIPQRFLGTFPRALAFWRVNQCPSVLDTAPNSALSAFYYVMEFLNLTSEEPVSVEKLTEKLEEFCAQRWEEVSNRKQQLLSLLPFPCASALQVVLMWPRSNTHVREAQMVLS